MSHKERIAELLAGYPDQLSDDELTELRLAASEDAALEASLDAIHEAEFLISMDEDEVQHLAFDGELSERAEERLAQAITQAKQLARDAAGIAESAAVAAVKIVTLRPAKDRSQWASWMALAAGLVLAGGTVVISRSPQPSGGDEMSTFGTPGDLSMKGAEPEAMAGDLMVRGTDDAPWTVGTPRLLAAGLRFFAVVAQPTYLALVEVQQANTAVVYPQSGSQWQVAAGTHLLQPPSASPQYSAASEGAATYVLVGSRSSLSVPAGGVLVSVAALVDGNPGARVLGEVEVTWQAPR